MASTLENIGYNSVAKVLTMAVGVATSTILARNLGAEDYGVVGVAMMVVGFLQRFSDVGINSALVQRSSMDERVQDTAQAVNAILVTLLFVCALIVAPFTTAVFKNQAVPAVVAVLSCSFLISAIGFLPSALLTREMRFAALRMPAVAGTIIRGIVSVTCALTGWKYWSLVAGTLAGNLTTALLLRTVRPVKTHWQIHRDIGKALLHFGLPLWGSGLLVFAAFNLDNFAIGSLLGTGELGYYTVALTWSTLVCSTLYETVHSVLFPRFSQMQTNRADMAAMYYRILRLVMFAAVLANAVLFSVGDGFLVTVLGKGNPRWLPSLTALRILCLYGAVRASTEPIGNAVMALGRPKLLFWSNLLPVSLEVCLLPWVALRWGLGGVASLVCAAYASQWFVFGPFLKRELKIGPTSLLRLVVPIVLAAVSAVFLSWLIPLAKPLLWLSIIIRSTAVTAVFALVHEVLTGGKIFSEIRLIVESRLRKAPVLSADSGAGPADTRLTNKA